MDTVNDVNQWLSQHYGGVTVEPSCIPGSGDLSLYLIGEAHRSTDMDSDTVSKFMDDPPYWIFCWASGVVMAQQLFAGKIDVEGKVVVDFGAGSGVVGVAALMNGAKKVYCCEIDALARNMIAFNADLNNVPVTAVASLDQVEEPIDLVLVADVLYDRSNLPLLDELKAYTNNILLADSRIKDLVVPGYEKYLEETSCSYPDFAESIEYNSVRLYRYLG